MLAIDRSVTAELLEMAFERVQGDIDSANPDDPSLCRIRDFSTSPRFKRWALECASDLLMVRKFPDITQAVLGLLTAGILVGMELQKLASEVGALESWYMEEDAPNPAALTTGFDRRAGEPARSLSGDSGLNNERTSGA
jgi:hypothetical protein